MQSYQWERIQRGWKRREASEINFRQGNAARTLHFLHRVEGQEEFDQELGLEKLTKHYAEQCFLSRFI